MNSVTPPLRPFSQLYVERGAETFPDTQTILARFPRAHITPIDSYKEVLNRPHQDWRRQKGSLKMVLAKREPPFLYPISDIVQPSAVTAHAYYTVPALNCLYDCAYCYLQGMFQSPHLVLFTNTEEYFAAVETALAEQGSLWLALTYETDLLALEGILPLTSRWIEFARRHPTLNLEIRTKSVAIESLRNTAPCPNVLFAWTLSPPEVAAQHEALAPSPAARLAAVQTMLTRGWKVRLCFDPILTERGWNECYERYITSVHHALESQKVHDITAGTFRMPNRYFRRLKNIRPDSSLSVAPYTHENDEVCYPEAERAAVRDTLSPRLEAFGVPVHWW